eukprot:Awhi_evm1s2251
MGTLLSLWTMERRLSLGPVKVWVRDRGSEFGPEFEAHITKHGTTIPRVPAGHHEANGLAERIIVIIMLDMRKRVEETGDEWDKHVDEWKFVFNTTPRSCLTQLPALV